MSQRCIKSFESTEEVCQPWVKESEETSVSRCWYDGVNLDGGVGLGVRGCILSMAYLFIYKIFKRNNIFFFIFILIETLVLAIQLQDFQLWHVEYLVAACKTI